MSANFIMMINTLKTLYPLNEKLFTYHAKFFRDGLRIIQTM